MTTNLRTNKKFKSLPLLMFAALLLFIAAFIGTISSFANATDEITEDLKGGEELALPADSDGTITIDSKDNANATITISGYVKRQVQEEAEERFEEANEETGFVPVVGAKVYLDGIEGFVTSDSNGYYKYENVPQYYVGHIHAEYNFGLFSMVSSTEPIYINMPASIYDSELNLVFYQGMPLIDNEVNVIINHKEGSDQSGHISSHLTVDEQQIDYYEVSEQENASLVKMPYQTFLADKNSNSENGGEAVLNFYNAKITVNGDTLILDADDNYTNEHYQQTLKAYANEGYKFDGWYGLKYRNVEPSSHALVFEQNYDYVKCYTGDYLYDFSTQLTMAYNTGKFDFDNSVPGTSDGGPVCFIARFVKETDFTHKITVKVDDKTKGYLTGTLGNCLTNNENAYLDEFQFNVTNTDESTELPITYRARVYAEEGKMDNSIAFYDSRRNGYELSYLQNTVQQLKSKIYGQFNFNAIGYNGYAFMGWEATDKDGKVVEFIKDLDYLCDIDQDLTFTAKFEAAVPFSGKVTDSNGQELPFASLSFNAAGNTFNSYTSLEGKYDISAFSEGGILTVAKNNFYVYTQEMSAEDVAAAARDGLDIVLQAPKNPVYLCGATYEWTRFYPKDKLSNNNEDNAQAVSEVNPLGRCLASFTDDNQEGKPVTVFYEDVGLSPILQSNGEWTTDGATFLLAVEKGAYGWMTISREGYNTLRIYIPEGLTDVDPGTQIDFGNDPRVKLDEDQLGDIQKDPEGFSRIFLTPANGLSIYVSTEDTEKGQIEVVYADGSTRFVDYTADYNFQVGDIVDVDYLSGELTINSINEEGQEYTKMRVLPAPNTDEGYAFFGWVGYTNYNERIEIMDANKLVNNLTIYAQYKKVSELNATGGEGHKLFSATFDSNELKHIGHEPYVFEDEEFSFRQYLGSTYTVEGNQIKFTFDESQENPDVDYGVPYIETTTVNSVAKDGYEFDHWTINGQDVQDGASGRISATDDFDVQASYKTNGDEPTPEDINGAAQTGDSIPFVAIVICGLVVIAAGTFAIRKYLIKK